VREDFVLPENIPSYRSRDISFWTLTLTTSGRTRGGVYIYKILALWVTILAAYKYFSIYGWILGLHRKESVSERIWVGVHKVDRNIYSPTPQNQPSTPPKLKV